MSRRIIKSLPDMKLARKRTEKPRLIREDVVVPKSVRHYGEGRFYHIHTFGCQANVRDEEIMGGYLELAGMKRALDESQADLVIINTCAVRENAEEKVYGEIGKFKARHQADPEHFVLCVCGCMMQEENVAKQITASYPYVNIVFGTHNVHNLLNLLAEHLERKKDLVDVISYSGDIVENLPSSRLDSMKAYVNIMYGCDKFCTYCIVPYTRGRERSRPLEDILKECKELVESGYQEITLLGQNVNSYGKDFHDGTNFATVLEAVAKLGIPRLRFMTSHPWDFSDDMLDVIAKYDNIMKCIHLPVQSGSSEVLRSMGRRYTRESYLALVSKIRERIPGCALTTDIIVGFPNETAEQFEETLTLAEEVNYDAAFTFIYSPRKGTPAAAIADNVTDKEKHERFDRLIKVIEASVMSHSAQMVGHVYDVLVDGPSKKDPNMLSGYTEKSKLVHFPGPSYLKGCIVPVKINEDHAFSMKGELVGDPILLLAERLSSLLKQEDEAKAYFEAKKALDEDPSYPKMRNRVEEAQKTMVQKAAEKDDEGYQKAKKDYLEAKKALDEHPLYRNYASACEELAPLLAQISEEIS